MTRARPFDQWCVILSLLLQPTAFTLGHQQPPICHIWGTFSDPVFLDLSVWQQILFFLEKNILFWLLRHRAARWGPIFSPVIQPPSALWAGSSSDPVLRPLLCSGTHQVNASKSLGSTRTFHAVSPEPGPLCKNEGCWSSPLDVPAPLQLIQNSSDDLSFLGLLLLHSLHGRQVSSFTHTPMAKPGGHPQLLFPLYPLRIFFSSPLLSIPTALALVYTPRITAVASLLDLAFCFTLPHQPSALLTECYPQKTSELFTPLLKVLRGFPRTFRFCGVQGPLLIWLLPSSPQPPFLSFPRKPSPNMELQPAGATCWEAMLYAHSWASTWPRVPISVTLLIF